MNSTHPVSPMMVVRPNTPTNRPNLASSNGGGTPTLPPSSSKAICGHSSSDVSVHAAAGLRHDPRHSNVQDHVAVALCHPISLEPHAFRFEQRPAGGQVELPAVPGATDDAIVHAEDVLVWT